MSFVLSLLSSTFLKSLLGWIFEVLNKKGDRELEAYKTATGADVETGKAFLQAQVETNREKNAQRQWWGAKLIILMSGVPASLHFGLVFMDSSCPATWGWNVVKGVARGGCGFGFTALPSPYDTYQWAIVQSFFLVMPALPVAKAFAGWLARKR